jgi:hypothetical protein
MTPGKWSTKAPWPKTRETKDPPPSKQGPATTLKPEGGTNAGAKRETMEATKEAEKPHQHRHKWVPATATESFYDPNGEKEYFVVEFSCLDEVDDDTHYVSRVVEAQEL